MKQELQTLIKTEEALFNSQIKFKEQLKKEFKCLSEDDLDKLFSTVNNELNLLLSSTLKYKSNRFVLKAKDQNWKDELVLTRNPGLKPPHDGYVSLNWEEVEEIQSNGNLILHGRDEYSEKAAKLACIEFFPLKSEKNINQEKLLEFYSYLNIYLEIVKTVRANLFETHQYNRWRNKKEEPTLIVESVGIVPYSIDFSFRIKEIKNKDKDSSNVLPASTVHAFKSNDDSYSSSPSLSDLKEIFKNYDKLEIGLMALEQTKKEIVLKLNNLIDKLKSSNKSFRLLQKLIN